MDVSITRTILWTLADRFKSRTSFGFKCAEVSGMHYGCLFQVLLTDFCQSLLSQLSELDDEEQALTTTLLNDLEAASSSGQIPYFRSRRADASRSGAEGKPTRWVVLITMSYLTRASCGFQEGVCIPFSRYQRPLELLPNPLHEHKMHCIRQLSPTHGVNVVRLNAFLYSSGVLISGAI